MPNKTGGKENGQESATSTNAMARDQRDAIGAPEALSKLYRERWWTNNVTNKEVRMNWELARTARGQLHDHRHAGHAHSWPIVISRREFVRTATGAAAAGLALGAGVWTPGFAGVRKNGEKENEEKSIAPVPIPGGSPGLSPFHVFGPTPDGSFDPIDAEPITITDFNGFVGLAYIDGTVQRTNKHTGEVRTLPMIGSDMRFMAGIYRGVDGRIHEGAFALV